MKFFTVEWATGQLSDDEFERRPDSYQSHLDQIVDRLTPAIGTLATGIDIHDGLINEISADKIRGELVIDLVCGDHEAGYSDLRIIYRGVDWSVTDLGVLENLANNVKAEALRDEVHLGPCSSFEHHILFWPYSEVLIRFSDLAISSTLRQNPADRSVKEVANRFSVKTRDP